MFTTKDLCSVDVDGWALALKIASVRGSIVTQCVSPPYKTLLEHSVVGVQTDSWSGYGRCDGRTKGTFLEHGDAQVLLALRMGAAHHGLRCALFCAVVVTHCQNLDLAVVLLETQAVHCCGATTQTNDISPHQNERDFSLL